jgi:hypothetical protein
MKDRQHKEKEQTRSSTRTPIKTGVLEVTIVLLDFGNVLTDLKKFVFHFPCTNNRKDPFLHLMASCLKTGSATIPKTITNLYSVPMIFHCVQNSRGSVIHNLSYKMYFTDGRRQRHNTIRPQNACGRIKTN